jgi:hypothetical protein
MSWQQIVFCVENWSIETVNMELCQAKARTAYLQNTMPLLKHGKKLELINQSLVPLRAMAIHTLLHPNSKPSLSELQQKLFFKLQQQEELVLLFAVLEKYGDNEENTDSSVIFFRQFYAIFNTTNENNMNEYIALIDSCLTSFDAMQAIYGV